MKSLYIYPSDNQYEDYLQELRIKLIKIAENFDGDPLVKDKYRFTNFAKRGLTWSDSYVGNPKIAKTKGSKRPNNEGGHYIRYSSVEDWVYLLRPGGTYKVSGVKNFKAAVKGFFRAGGAKYDYAALGYSGYMERIKARKYGIDKQNPDVLDRLDQALFSEVVDESNSKKLKVAQNATHWYTGEVIPDWVKEFELIEEKEVTYKAYLLGNEGIAIGQIIESDVA